MRNGSVGGIYYPNGDPVSSAARRGARAGSGKRPMRVLTGESKGKRLRVPAGADVRPTAGRVRKSIFDALGPASPAAAVLDLFSGSGSLGIEALSRGAEFCAFVDRDPAAGRAIRENLRFCGYAERSRVLDFDFRKALSILRAEGARFGLVFADPPYRFYDGTRPGDLVREIRDVLEDEGTIVVEHRSRDAPETDGFETRTRRYGGTSVSFLRRRA